MTRLKLNASFETVGGFWRPGDRENVIAGKVVMVEGRGKLEVAPAFAPLSESSGNMLALLGGGFEPKRIEALNGRTRDGLCTLFYLLEEVGRGVVDFTEQVEIKADIWRISGLLMGLHVESSKQESIDAAAFYFNKVHQLLPKLWQVDSTPDTTAYVMPHQAVNAFEFRSTSLQARIICEVVSGGRTKTKGTAVLKPLARVRIIPDKPKSLDWFAEVGPQLENFFTLMMGTSVSRTALQLFQGDDKQGWFVREDSPHKEKVDIAACIHCSYQQAGAAMERWLDRPAEKRPVERTIFGMLRRSRLFEETKFLALAQAVEGFGRIHYDPDLNFIKVLGKVYDSLSKDFAGALLGERKRFISTAVQTRNFFTHLGGKKGGDVLDSAINLFLFNQKLHAALRAVLLLDVGLGEAVIRDPVSRQATKWS